MSAIQALAATRWSELRSSPAAKVWPLLALAGVPLLGAPLFAFSGLYHLHASIDAAAATETLEGIWKDMSAFSMGMGAVFGAGTLSLIQGKGARGPALASWPHLPVRPWVRTVSEVLLAGLPVGVVALLMSSAVVVLLPLSWTSIFGVAGSAAAGAGAIGLWFQRRRDRVVAPALAMLAASSVDLQLASDWLSPTSLLAIVCLGLIDVRSPGWLRLTAHGPISFNPTLGLIRLVVLPVLWRSAATVVFLGSFFWISFSSAFLHVRWVVVLSFLCVYAAFFLSALWGRLLLLPLDRGPFDWLPVPPRRPWAVAMVTYVGLGLASAAVVISLLPALDEVYIDPARDYTLNMLISAGAREPRLLLQDHEWTDPRVVAALLLSAAILGPTVVMSGPDRKVRSLVALALFLGGVGLCFWETRSTLGLFGPYHSWMEFPTRSEEQAWAADVASRTDAIRAELAAGRDQRALAAWSLAALSALVAFVPRRERR